MGVRMPCEGGIISEFEGMKTLFFFHWEAASNMTEVGVSTQGALDMGEQDPIFPFGIPHQQEC